MDSIHSEIVVLGAGPGGYAAAFYAADLGKKVLLVEQDKKLGGVCLNRGCIPSKALLYATRMIFEARESAHRGVTFGPPTIEVDKLRAWKNSVVDKLVGGISFLAKKRGVQVLTGRGYFEGSQSLRVETTEGQQSVTFDKAIIAVGSKAALPKVFDLGNPRVMTSTEALEVEEIPEDFLVVGGGYIGMELGSVYANLGSKVVVVEALQGILSGADPDLIRPVMQYAQKNFRELRFNTKVTQMSTKGKKVRVVTEGPDKVEKEELFDRVLVSVGRVPRSQNLGLENTQVEQDERGFIKVNDKQETSDPAILAIGDIAGGVLLAHKASKEARIAVETIVGQESTSTGVIIPAVVFTDPELAWCGVTETEARAKGLVFEVAKFPWGASGRALTYDRPDGLTKLIVDSETERIIGVGIVGHGAGELIAEGVLAIEMGATVGDLAETVHPHPTLSETLMEAAEVFYGVSTSVFAPKKHEE
ncbi:MAG TPA: dihydrolipoyl dehydrogenase [Candidatus Baltobacteraceae bacterium]|nr:dihydrolipoyl dehydrogenase [Candidatus Baltobacteraceae bacterium]